MHGDLAGWAFCGANCTNLRLHVLERGELRFLRQAQSEVTPMKTARSLALHRCRSCIARGGRVRRRAARRSNLRDLRSGHRRVTSLLRLPRRLLVRLCRRHCRRNCRYHCRRLVRLCGSKRSTVQALLLQVPRDEPRLGHRRCVEHPGLVRAEGRLDPRRRPLAQQPRPLDDGSVAARRGGDLGGRSPRRHQLPHRKQPASGGLDLRRRALLDLVAARRGLASPRRLDAEATL
mmetsp:Transcript_11974/g.35053  ORF Transcript_11974/g.35053 Transcript_11974/m.35053 type:complete len:233 (+) Transcript_11974:880-1578(+)